MVHKCAFPGCKNLKKKLRARKSALAGLTSDRVTSHRFPVNHLWLLAVHRDITLSIRYFKHMRLCSEHFSQDDFRADEGKARRYLTNTAVPVNYLPEVCIHLY